MRISEFFIKGFGIYENVQVNSLSSGMNLFLGDNEAGKSTLLAFFRDILFGFESGRGANSNTYKPIGSTLHGGRISLVRDTDQSSYVIEREPGKAAGNVTVTLLDGSQKGEEVLHHLFPGIDKEVYRNIYGFSLEELQDFGTLSAESVKGRIYSSGAGAGQVDIMKIDEKLGSQMEKLFKPRGSSSAINKLFSDLEKAEDAIRGFSDQSEKYFDAQKRIPVLQEDIRRLEAEISEIDKRLTLQNKILESWNPWEEIQKAKSELATIPLVDQFPEKGEERYSRCKENIDKEIETLNRLTIDIDSKRKELSELQVDMRVLAEKAQIEETLHGKDQYESAKSDLPKVKSQEERLNAEISDLLKDCGDEWTEAKAMAFDISIPTRDLVNKMDADIIHLEKEWETAKARLQDKKSVCDKDEMEIQSKERELSNLKSDKSDVQTITDKENAIRKARQCFSNIENHNIRKYERNRELQKLQDERTKKEQSPVKRGSMMMVDIIVALLLLGLAAYFYHISPVMATVLLAIGVLIVVVGYQSERNAKKILSDMAFKLESLDSMIEMNKKDLSSIESQIQGEKANIQRYSHIIGSDLRSPQDVEDADNVIRKLREKNARIEVDERGYRELIKTFEVTKREYLNLQADVAEKDQAFVAVRGKWCDWLRQNSLPIHYRPDTVRNLIHIIETLREKRNEANEYHARVEKMTDNIEEFENKIKDLLRKCEREEPDRSRLVSNLIQLREDLGVAQENRNKRDGLLKALQEKENDSKVCRDVLNRYYDELKELLRTADANDENSFWERSKWYANRVELNKKIRNYTVDLQRIAGEIEVEKINEMLAVADIPSMEIEMQELREKRSQLQKERDEKNQDIGMCKQTIGDLETSDELSKEIAYKESLRTELNRIASDWAILTMCKKILKDTRDRYEREKQPLVIKAASDVIKTMTGGAYQSVFAPLDEKKFHLITPNLERKDISILSRGTREQLYLAIRFGLIGEYDGEPLPVIMDDILVNFDPKRAKAAAESILALSKSHQVLFFTCHPQIREMFIGLNEGVAQYTIGHAQISRN